MPYLSKEEILRLLDQIIAVEMEAPFFVHSKAHQYAAEVDGKVTEEDVRRDLAKANKGDCATCSRAALLVGIVFG